jgi:hypothetical protein
MCVRCGWQLVRYCVSLSFSGPKALKIPAVRNRSPVGLDTDTAGFLGSGRPPNRGGLSVLKTLHLVADNQKAYQMF